MHATPAMQMCMPVISMTWLHLSRCPVTACLAACMFCTREGRAAPVLACLQLQHSMRQVVAATLQKVDHLTLLLHHCTRLPARVLSISTSPPRLASGVPECDVCCLCSRAGLKARSLFPTAMLVRAVAKAVRSMLGKAGILGVTYYQLYQYSNL